MFSVYNMEKSGYKTVHQIWSQMCTENVSRLIYTRILAGIISITDEFLLLMLTSCGDFKICSQTLWHSSLQNVDSNPFTPSASQLQRFLSNEWNVAEVILYDYSFHLTLSLITSSGGRSLPCHEDTQNSQRKDLHEEELSLLTKVSTNL